MVDDILTYYAGMDEVGSRLSIHVESARRLVRQGRLPGVRVGNKWLVRRDLLEDFARQYDPRPGRRPHESSTPRPQP